jgi:dolichol-phosphate mannosyltransferase
MGTVITVKTLFQSDTRLCAVAGFSLAVTTNFLLNRYWTFEEGRQSPFFRRYLVFVGVCCIGMSARLGVMHLLIVYSTLDSGYGYIVVNFIGIVVATAINFFGSKFFAFSA